MNRKVFLSSAVVLCVAVFLSGCAQQRPAAIFSKDVQPAGNAVSVRPAAIVVYDSWTGNTKTIAEEVARVLGCQAVQADEAKIQAMGAYDLVVVGSPVHGGRPTDKIEDFLSGLEKPRASAVFATFGAPLFGPFMAEVCLDFMEEKLGGTSIGRFQCHGFHHIFFTYPAHPDDEDRAEAARFAAGLLERSRRAESTQP